jgi:hypothetical protein
VDTFGAVMVITAVKRVAFGHDSLTCRGHGMTPLLSVGWCLGGESWRVFCGQENEDGLQLSYRIIFRFKLGH